MKIKIIILLILFSVSIFAKEISSINTSEKEFFNKTIYTHSFKDPDIDGVACFLTAPELNANSNLDSASISCIQYKNIMQGNLEDRKNIFSDSIDSAYFNRVRVDRIYNKEFNSLIYTYYYTDSLNTIHNISVIPLFGKTIIYK